MVSFVPNLSSAPIPPRVVSSCYKGVLLPVLQALPSPPSLLRTSLAHGQFGQRMKHLSVYPPAFLWPNPSLPSAHGGKTVLKWDQSTEKPEHLESKLILQTPNQSTKIAASIYPPAARPLGSLMGHSTLSPPRGRGWWEERTRLTPLSSSILLCSFLK